MPDPTGSTGIPTMQLDHRGRLLEDAVGRASPVRRFSPWWIFAAAFAALYVPTVVHLARTAWSEDANGHGPIVATIAAWLLWRRLGSGAAVADSSGSGRHAIAGWLCLVAGLALFCLGRALSIISVETFSLIPVAAAGVLLFGPRGSMRQAWFPLFFLVFAVPLPAELVDLVTGPMKIGVSWAAEHLLFAAGYPVARQGVILHVGPYQLLVADACSGLHTMLTLEALGLLYINLVQHASWVRNVVLACLIIPISLAANVVRVIALILVTYYLGDEAGQGFLHGLAGMVLFLVGLVLIIALDTLLRFATPMSRHLPKADETRPA